MLQKFFRNKNVSKKLKSRLKKTIIDKTLTYASDTSILTKRDRKQINIFERSVEKKFRSSIWQLKRKLENINNKEMYMQCLKKPTITKTIGWIDYVGLGMDRERKKIEFPKVLYMNLEATRLRVRPRNRWQDEVREDGRLVGGKGWKERVYNTEEWKKLLRMARNRSILHLPMEWMNEWMNIL